jgi:large subunit ribosomal protein L30
MKQIRITQIKSGIGRPLRQKRTLQALGIRKMHHSVEKDATPQILGMVAKVNHLVTVEELSVEPEKIVPNELP